VSNSRDAEGEGNRCPCVSEEPYLALADQARDGRLVEFETKASIQEAGSMSKAEAEKLDTVLLAVEDCLLAQPFPGAIWPRLDPHRRQQAPKLDKAGKIAQHWNVC